MTDFDVDAAQQLCDNATEGPWLAEDSLISAGEDYVVDVFNDGLVRITDADAGFIAAARTLLPDALAEIRRLRAQVQRVEARREYCSVVVYETSGRTCKKQVPCPDHAGLGEPS